jgi:hypothetical protein
MFCIFENMKRLTKTQVESMIDLYLSGKEKNTKESRKRLTTSS